MNRLGDILPHPTPPHPSQRGASGAPAASSNLPATPVAERRQNAVGAASSASGVAIPERLVEPAVSPAAASYIGASIAREAERAAFAAASPTQRETMFVSPIPARPALTRQQVAECERAADAIAWHLRPVSLPHLAAWLAPVNAAVRNPQSRDDMMARVVALHEMLGDLPGGAFTADTRRRLRPDWFPSAGEIRAVVEPGARLLTAQHELLLRMVEPVAAEPAAPSYTPPTEAERAAMSAKAHAVMAELRAAATEREAGKRGAAGRALPLSDGALLAHYERLASNGDRAAAFRADAIRARAKAEPDGLGGRGA